MQCHRLIISNKIMTFVKSYMAVFVKDYDTLSQSLEQIDFLKNLAYNFIFFNNVLNIKLF
jgi:hypothetical protein